VHGQRSEGTPGAARKREQTGAAAAGQGGPATKKKAKKAAYINITVKTVMGQEIPVRIRGSATVEDLKVKLYRVTDLEPEEQVLVFNGEELDDEDELLAAYRIQDGSTLHLMPRVSSGFIATY
jgi:molybdopterin converting factor small subunit